MYSINTPSTYQPFIDISVNDSSIYYSIKKIIETELINKISNFEALKEYINKSKNVLEKISYVKDTNFTFRNGEGFLYFFTQLDQNSINEEMINWIRNLIYSFPELLDQQDNYGRTPIYFAIKNDKDLLVNLFIEMNCNLEITSYFGQTPLLLAASLGKISILDQLIKAGSNVSVKGNINGDEILHSLLKFFFINDEQISWLKNLIQNFPNILNAQNSDGYTPLHLAILMERESLISLFIEMKCDLEIKSYLKETPLLLATSIRNTSIMDLLIKAGSNVTIKSHFTNDGILHLIVNNFDNSTQISWLKNLIQNFPSILNLQNRKGYTPIHQAILMDRESFVSLFIEMKCDLEIASNLGKTPLLLAASCEKMSIVDLLVESGANVNARDNDGFGVLYFLSKSKNFENDAEQIRRIENIINRYPEWLNNENIPDCIIMKLASMNGNISLVNLLVANKFSLDIISAYFVNKLNCQIIPESIDYQKVKIHQKTLIPKLKVYLQYESRGLYTPTNINKGLCQGLVFLFAYYLSRGKEEEFYQLLEEIINWDGKEESLKQEPSSTIISQVYSTTEELLQHSTNDILFFQLLSYEIDNLYQIDFVSKYNFLKKDDNLQPFRANFYDLTKQKDDESILVKKYCYMENELCEKSSYVIGSDKCLEKFIKIEKNKNNFFSIGLSKITGHAIGVHISSEEIATIYDPEYPYRIAPFKLTESSLEFFVEIIESYIKIVYEYYDVIHVDHYIFNETKKI